MFKDRTDAGRQLAKKLEAYAGEHTVVIALPRGGVVTGYEVARVLGAPLDILAVRKIGHPFEPEYAIGAIAPDGTSVFNEEETAPLDAKPLQAAIAAERAEAKRRSILYRDGKAPLDIAGKVAVIVDDGIATGLSMRLAVRVAKAQKPARLIVAAPVASRGALESIRGEGVDDLITLEPPESFEGAIGAHYERFDQVEDDEVMRLMRAAPMQAGIPADGVTLAGILTVPEKTIGLVVFVHGSGSSRFSPRNALVALELQDAGIATLLIDLLTEEEDEDYQARFDIELLSRRLGAVLEWVKRQPARERLAIGLFGASTGAAAALTFAARSPSGVRAVVSRGGRPDLAMSELGSVTAPTLLIVGGDDREVVALNEQAFAALSCEKKLEIIPGATHLFEEAGALEKVALLAREWFSRHFRHHHAEPWAPSLPYSGTAASRAASETLDDSGASVFRRS
ncbi:MAG TPA: phosphoribosyltransferase family protein [Candidatus Paceibacterota bacterium]|nr:phosphoribosyltransferase family protein [Candidatus Paceibacterota bacterium]